MHKRSHTGVRIDENGRLLATKTVGATTQDHVRLVKWASEAAGERLWAIEDCRHLTRRLERDLIAAGESVVRVRIDTDDNHRMVCLRLGWWHGPVGRHTPIGAMPRSS